MASRLGISVGVVHTLLSFHYFEMHRVYRLGLFADFEFC
jgi:hypothetical protein